MRSAAYRANLLKLGVMALLALAACAATCWWTSTPSTSTTP